MPTLINIRIITESPERLGTLLATLLATETEHGSAEITIEHNQLENGEVVINHAPVVSKSTDEIAATTIAGLLQQPQPGKKPHWTQTPEGRARMAKIREKANRKATKR